MQAMSSATTTTAVDAIIYIVLEDINWHAGRNEHGEYTYSRATSFSTKALAERYIIKCKRDKIDEEIDSVHTEKQKQQIIQHKTIGRYFELHKLEDSEKYLFFRTDTPDSKVDEIYTAIVKLRGDKEEEELCFNEWKIITSILDSQIDHFKSRR